MQRARVLGCALFTVFALVICGEAARQLSHKHRPPQPGLKTLVYINGESFYLGIKQYLTWYDAKAACEALGMQLVTLDTQERWTMISDWLLEHPAYNYWFWSSGQKNRTQQEFVWTSTGNTFNFTAWNSGEPSRGASAESCMDFYAEEGGWDDDTCTSFDHLMYMCENIPA